MDDDHVLIVLSDSALPIGSFAFSNGLETYVSHNPHFSQSDLVKFLFGAIDSVTSTAVPFIAQVYESPENVVEINTEYGATLTCPVQTRASVTQGKSLVSLATKSLGGFIVTSNIDDDLYAVKVRSGESAGHFAIAWAWICQRTGVSRSMHVIVNNSKMQIDRAVYTFLLNFLRSTLSAAVRLGVIGPYQSQKILCDVETRHKLRECMSRGCDMSTDDVAQTWPMLELLQGRQELLYSRVFNS
jgi:urease accessory protein